MVFLFRFYLFWKSLSWIYLSWIFPFRWIWRYIRGYGLLVDRVLNISEPSVWQPDTLPCEVSLLFQLF